MEEKKISWPKFTGKEMADLIAFLYFLKFVDKAGDSQKGKKIFSQKGCETCHGKNGLGGGSGPNLARSVTLITSIDMAQILWNHAPVMEERILEKVMEWPELTGGEMADLFAYLISIKKKDETK
jgi:cytochrome c